MAEALVSEVLTQLTRIISRGAEQEIRLVAGAEEDVRKLTSKFEAIQDVLVDAETRQLNDPHVRKWLNKLKNIAYDMEDVLDEWNTSILKRKLQVEGVYGSTSSITGMNKVFSFFNAPFVCFGKLSLRHGIAHKIKPLNKKLDEIVAEQQLYRFSETTNVVDATINLQERTTTPFIDKSEIEGRDEEKRTLVNKLLSGSSEGGKDLRVISLVGLGGIGKTTLARLAYNHDEIVNGFEKRGWVCVSEPVNKIKIAKDIIQDLTGSASSLTGLGPLLKEILECIKGKRFLLVLDDVWTENRSDLEDLFLCLKQSRARCTVLVTTRNDRVASVFRSDIISIKELSEDKCWSLFSRLALSEMSTYDRENFGEIGRKIVEKCKGLPLAAKSLGSLLRFKKSIGDWESILGSEIWKLDFDEGPLSSLLLSYNYLPYMVKRCFSYCAVFPKDYPIWKDELIQLWMAQGYLTSKRNQALEMTGNEYFNILASRSFFQEFEKDELGEILCCKMHDIVHDLAKYLTQNECLTIEVDGDENTSIPSCENTRHAMIVLYDGASLPISVIQSKTLRSLLVEYDDCFDISVWKILNQLRYLRVLKFEHTDLDEPNSSNVDIPREIQNLIQLKHLSVNVKSALKELPEELCELYNLQTLDVYDCSSLKKLPRGIEKLINLRHLVNCNTASLSYMPKGMERLTHLRTLNEFVVSDGNHAEEASGLESLKYLKHLQGSLMIRRLGNVRDVNEAKEAELHNKTKLSMLELEFDTSEEQELERRRTAKDDEQLFEALQPLPSNLQWLAISYYRGQSTSQIWLRPLTQLRQLDIKVCENLESLPPLWKLSSLESLCLRELGVFASFASGILTSPSSTPPIIAFPKLTSLVFDDMPEWEEWDYGITGEDENIQIMPSLGELTIEYCPKLRALPDHLFLNASLKKLEIVECPLLYSYLKERGQQWPLNFHIPEISYSGKTEDDSDPKKYKIVIDPMEHKFEFEIKESDTDFESDTEEDT